MPPRLKMCGSICQLADGAGGTQGGRPQHSTLGQVHWVLKEWGWGAPHHRGQTERKDHLAAQDIAPFPAIR